ENRRRRFSEKENRFPFCAKISQFGYVGARHAGSLQRCSRGELMSKDEGAGPGAQTASEGARQSPLLRALEWIGLDLSGPERSSILLVGIYALLVFIPVALVVW